MKKIIGLLALCSAAVLVSGPAHALVTVAAGGGADQVTIQAGLDAAAVGEEVRVIDSGTYAESLNVNGEVLTSVPAGATIDAGGGNGAIIWGDVNATIDGFIITNAGNGIHIDASPADVQIMNCTINAGAGVNFGAGVATATITNCTINAGGHGVLFNAGEGHTCHIVGCTISATVEHAVTLYRTATVTIADSFLNNCAGSSIRVDGSDTGVNRIVTVTNTQLNNNGVCMGLHRKGIYSFTDCQMNGNGALGPDGNWQGGFFMDGNSAGSTLNMTRTTLNNNVNRGIFTGRPINLNMDGCTVEGNGGWGILIDDYSGNTTDPITMDIKNTTFTNNGGLDIYMLAKGTNTTATVTDCTFNGDTTHLNAEANNSPTGKTILADIERNTVLGGAPATLSYLSTGSKIVNNLFEQGGTGLSVVNSAVDIANNTLVGTVDGNGVNISNLNDKVVNLVNNIIAGYDIGIVSDGAGLANVTISNNLIQAVTADADASILSLVDNTNILGVSPDFLSASAVLGAGNYHLSDTSAALGRGLEVGINDDMDGNSRPMPAGSAPDLGAYENALVPVEISNFMID